MRLVDADKARECFGGDGVTGAVMQRMFDSLPTIDTVPVVRCQECRCWKPSGGYAGDNINDLQRLGGCKWAVACVRENDFCSRGQRKEDEQDAD